MFSLTVVRIRLIIHGICLCQKFKEQTGFTLKRKILYHFQQYNLNTVKLQYEKIPFRYPSFTHNSVKEISHILSISFIRALS